MHPTLARILNEVVPPNFGALNLSILHTDPQGQHQYFTQDVPAINDSLSLGQLLDEVRKIYCSSAPQYHQIRQVLTPPLGYTGIVIQVHIQRSELPEHVLQTIPDVDDDILIYVIHAEPHRSPTAYLTHHTWPEARQVDTAATEGPYSHTTAQALATTLADHTPHTQETRPSHLDHRTVHAIATFLSSSDDGIYSIHATATGYDTKLMTNVDYDPLNATTVTDTLRKLTNALKSPTNRATISRMIDPHTFEGVALSITGPELDQSISDTLALASINGALANPDRTRKTFETLPTRNQVCVVTVDHTVLYSEHETHTDIRYTRDQTTPMVLASNPDYLTLLTDATGADDIELPNDENASSILIDLVSLCITENDNTIDLDRVLSPLPPVPPPLPPTVTLDLESAHMLTTAISSTNNTGLYLLSATTVSGHPCTKAIYIPPPAEHPEALFSDPERLLSAITSVAHDAFSPEAMGLPALDEDSVFQGLAFLVHSRAVDAQMARRIIQGAETGDPAVMDLLEGRSGPAGRTAESLTLALVDGSTYLHSTHAPDGTTDMPSHTTTDLDTLDTMVTDSNGHHPGHYTDHYSGMLPLLDNDTTPLQGPLNPLGPLLHKATKALASLYR